jgi:hypothetical protein
LSIWNERFKEEQEEEEEEEGKQAIILMVNVIDTPTTVVITTVVVWNEDAGSDQFRRDCWPLSHGSSFSLDRPCVCYYNV